MKPAFIRIAAVLALCLALSLAASAQDINVGIAKFQGGDFAGALRDLVPFAEQGSATAQFLVGVLYTTGQGVDQHYGDAAIWFRRAAEQGQARAQFNLGVLYAEGQGVAQDREEAFNWYRRAALQGYAAAQFSLAVAYFNGDGVAQDPVLAHVWANVAANSGHEDAAGVRYRIAERISASDLVTAQQIADRCREQGYEYCVR